MAPRLPAEYRAVTEEHRARLARLIDRRGALALRSTYEQAVAELERKLYDLVASGRGDTMTAHQSRVLLAQAKVGMVQISAQLNGGLAEASLEAQHEGLRGLIRDIKRLEGQYTGAATPLPIEQAAQFRGIIDEQRTSLLKAHHTSMARYGADTVLRMEDELSKSLLAGETSRQAVQRVADVAHNQWWQAERIVRTEMAWAFNSTAAGGLAAAEDELPDMMMRWSEHVNDETFQPLDDRVGVDSIAMHGQLAPPGGEFVMPSDSPAPDAKGNIDVPEGLIGMSWAFPPNRPNDRAIVQPWRARWGVPGWLYRGGVRVPYAEHLVTRRAAQRPAPEVAKPPPPPPKPRIDPTRLSEADIDHEQMAKAIPAQGVPLASDAGAVENQDIRVRRIRDDKGVDSYQFLWKMTDGAGVLAQKQLLTQGAQDGNWSFEKYVPDPDGVLRSQGMEYVKPAVQTVTTRSRGLVWGSPATEPAQRKLRYGRTGALSNHVELTVNTADPKAAARALEESLKMLGVEDPMAKPDFFARQDLLHAKIVGKFAPNVDEVAELVRAKRSPGELYGMVAAGDPVARAVYEDADEREVYPGHRAHYSKALAEHLQKNGVVGLYHDSGAPTEVIADVITKDGLMSSARRWSNGVFTGGMSTEEDFRTGGADGVFTRVTKDRSELEDAGMRLVIKTEEIGRLDWWAFPRDEFGAAGAGDFDRRWSVGAIAKTAYPGATNEVIFQHGIPKESISHVVASSSNRTRLLDELKRRGVKEVNGVPVDQFVRLRR